MFSKDDIKPVIILFYAAAAASVWKYCTLQTSNVLIGEYKIITAFVLFGLLPMSIVRFVFCEKLADYGLQFGNPLRTVRSFLMMAPFAALIAYLSGQSAVFADVYPFNELLRVQYTGLEHRIGYGLFAVHCVLYLGYYFGWEFLFRGFMQHGLSPRCGLPAAVCVQTLASVMLHYGHPGSEVFGAFAAGLVWGFIAYRTRSILSGFGQHAVLGIVLDAMMIYQ
ncbi:MAG: CPBP family intramembrane metalloprotease [Planctomycetaceae bacterium]|jgi:membrane protease YdiL (CAAX protease family)|nr:CPBP family intramembrane metalloprotease [Planctomycetaceae bacterium]